MGQEASRYSEEEIAAHEEALRAGDIDSPHVNNGVPRKRRWSDASTSAESDASTEDVRPVITKQAVPVVQHPRQPTPEDEVDVKPGPEELRAAALRMEDEDQRKAEEKRRKKELKRARKQERQARKVAEQHIAERGSTTMRNPVDENETVEDQTRSPIPDVERLSEPALSEHQIGHNQGEKKRPRHTNPAGEDVDPSNVKRIKPSNSITARPSSEILRRPQLDQSSSSTQARVHQCIPLANGDSRAPPATAAQRHDRSNTLESKNISRATATEPKASLPKKSKKKKVLVSASPAPTAKVEKKQKKASTKLPQTKTSKRSDKSKSKSKHNASVKKTNTQPSPEDLQEILRLKLKKRTDKRAKQRERARERQRLNQAGQDTDTARPDGGEAVAARTIEQETSLGLASDENRASTEVNAIERAQSKDVSDKDQSVAPEVEIGGEPSPHSDDEKHEERSISGSVDKANSEQRKANTSDQGAADLANAPATMGAGQHSPVAQDIHGLQRTGSASIGPLCDDEVDTGREECQSQEKDHHNVDRDQLSLLPTPGQLNVLDKNVPMIDAAGSRVRDQPEQQPADELLELASDEVPSERSVSPVPDSEASPRAVSEELGEDIMHQSAQRQKPASDQLHPDRTHKQTSWSIDQYEAIFTAASDYLASRPENEGKAVAVEDLRAVIDENPTLMQWIERMERANIQLDRVRFTEALQAVAPIDADYVSKVRKSVETNPTNHSQTSRRDMVLDHLARQFICFDEDGLFPSIAMYETRNICIELGIPVPDLKTATATDVVNVHETLRDGGVSMSEASSELPGTNERQDDVGSRISVAQISQEDGDGADEVPFEHATAEAIQERRPAIKASTQAEIATVESRDKREVEELVMEDAPVAEAALVADEDLGAQPAIACAATTERQAPSLLDVFATFASRLYVPPAVQDIPCFEFILPSATAEQDRATLVSAKHRILRAVGEALDRLRVGAEKKRETIIAQDSLSHLDSPDSMSIAEQPLNQALFPPKPVQVRRSKKTVPDTPRPEGDDCPCCHSATPLNQWRWNADESCWMCFTCHPVPPPTARHVERPERNTCPQCQSPTLVHQWKWDASELFWICAKCHQRKTRGSQPKRRKDVKEQANTDAPIDNSADEGSRSREASQTSHIGEIALPQHNADQQSKPHSKASSRARPRNKASQRRSTQYEDSGSEQAASGNQSSFEALIDPELMAQQDASVSQERSREQDNHDGQDRALVDRGDAVVPDAGNEHEQYPSIAQSTPVVGQQATKNGNASRIEPSVYDMCSLCNAEPASWNLDGTGTSNTRLCHGCYAKDLQKDIGPRREELVQTQAPKPKELPVPIAKDLRGIHHCQWCNVELTTPVEFTDPLAMKDIRFGEGSNRSCRKCHWKNTAREREVLVQKAAEEGWNEAVPLSAPLRQLMEKCNHDMDLLIVVLKDENDFEWPLIRSTLARTERRADSLYTLKKRYVKKKQEQGKSVSSVS